MAKILAILCSGRRKGYTATLLAEAIEGAKEISGQVEIEMLYLHDYSFSPCTSCFHCIRDTEHKCILDDDFGRKGKGEIFQKIDNANGWIIADPVHMWGPTAMCHLFVERCYPFVWSGKLEGMPVVSISCATNQGMHRLANAEICKWAFAIGLRYIDGLSVHASYFQESLKDARHLGKKLAESALSDEKDGRQKFVNDEERYLYYMDKAWNGLNPYMDNLSNGSFGWQSSMIETALKRSVFKQEDAVQLLEKSSTEFKEAVRYYNLNDYENAIKYLVRASSFWTHATWKEFLEEQAIKASPPNVYRPLPEDKNSGKK